MNQGIKEKGQREQHVQRLVTQRNLVRVRGGRRTEVCGTRGVRRSLTRDELRETGGVRSENMWTVLGSSDIIFKASGGLWERCHDSLATGWKEEPVRR